LNKFYECHKLRLFKAVSSLAQGLILIFIFLYNFNPAYTGKSRTQQITPEASVTRLITEAVTQPLLKPIGSFKASRRPTTGLQ
jgi:hypothetical protein